MSTTEKQTTTTYLVWDTDFSHAIEITEDSAKEAAEEYVHDGDWSGAGQTSTIYINVHVAEKSDVDEDDDEGDYDSKNYKIAVDPDSPEPDAEWQSPHWAVGGLEENPGVCGNGGGVVITEVCLASGCAKITDTWAKDSQDGEEGLESIKYVEGYLQCKGWVLSDCETFWRHDDECRKIDGSDCWYARDSEDGEITLLEATNSDEAEREAEVLAELHGGPFKIINATIAGEVF